MRVSGRGHRYGCPCRPSSRQVPVGCSRQGLLMGNICETRRLGAERNVTIYIDDDVLETFRQRGDAAGKGYQTAMNEALRDYLDKVKQPLDEETLRRVIQEELRAAR